MQGKALPGTLNLESWIRGVFNRIRFEYVRIRPICLSGSAARVLHLKVRRNIRSTGTFPIPLTHAVLQLRFRRKAWEQGHPKNPSLPKAEGCGCSHPSPLAGMYRPGRRCWAARRARHHPSPVLARPGVLCSTVSGSRRWLSRLLYPAEPPSSPILELLLQVLHLIACGLLALLRWLPLGARVYPQGFPLRLTAPRTSTCHLKMLADSLPPCWKLAPSTHASSFSSLDF